MAKAQSAYSKRMQDIIAGELGAYFETHLRWMIQRNSTGRGFTADAVQAMNYNFVEPKNFQIFMKFNYPCVYREWLNQIGQAVASNVMFAGAAVRRKARQSIRRVKGEVFSKPGEPPKTRSGRLKDTIRFAEDERTGNVLVGPVGGSSNVPHILEYGGTARSSKSLRRAAYRVGDWGPVALQPEGKTWASAQRVRGYDESGKITHIWAVRRKLVSPAQAARANRLQNEALLRGRFADERYTLAPRPYMSPALTAAGPEIIARWADSL